MDLLILKTLSLAPQHGWGIGQQIERMSHGALEVSQGSLYPALQRLEHAGHLVSEWQTTDNNRRARYYSITKAGRRELGTEVAEWKRFVAAVDVMLLVT